MKAVFAIVLVGAMCALISEVSCENPPKVASTSTVTSTTVKPWTQKFKDGLRKFLQGAAVVGAVQQGFQNARGSGKHKSLGHSSPATISKH